MVDSEYADPYSLASGCELDKIQELLPPAPLGWWAEGLPTVWLA